MYKLFIVRLLKLLKSFGAIKNIHKITFVGTGVSLNKFYSQGHWSMRHKLKNEFGNTFKNLFSDYGKLTWMQAYSILIFYNSRHDPDNVIGMEKLFIDALKEERDQNGKIIKKGYIHDDSKKYCKGVFIVPDITLKTNTFEFILLEH